MIGGEGISRRAACTTHRYSRQCGRVGGAGSGGEGDGWRRAKAGNGDITHSVNNKNKGKKSFKPDKNVFIEENEEAQKA